MLPSGVRGERMIYIVTDSGCVCNRMSYSEFLERVSFARETSDGTGTWGRHHEDIKVDGNTISNTSCTRRPCVLGASAGGLANVTRFGCSALGRGRTALMSKSATKGKHVVELKILHMSGTVFIGAMQATRRVWIRAQKTVRSLFSH